MTCYTSSYAVYRWPLLPQHPCSARFLKPLGNLPSLDLRNSTPSKGRRLCCQWLDLVRSFHKELGQHESRSAAELEALKKSNAQADDELGRSVESIVARQAQLRGDVHAQQDSMRSNESAISCLQSEACCCGPSRGTLHLVLVHLKWCQKIHSLGHFSCAAE